MNRLSLAVSLCCLVSLHGTSKAGAPVPIPRDTVADRARPAFEPLGLPVGSFTLYPQLAIDATRLHNIYSQGENEIDDTVAVVNPRLELRSNWSRHALAVSAEAEAGRYANNPTENYDDTRLSASGNITVSRNSGLRLSARLASLHEDRFSPDSRRGSTPTLFDQSAFVVGYQHERSRISLQIDVALTSTDFDDVDSAEGSIENDDRDRERTDVRVRAAYDVTPEFEVSARAALTSFDYTTPVDGIALSRSSSGGEVAIGARFDPTPVTSLDAFVGYSVRDYDDAQLEDIETTIYGATLAWRVSGLTTLSATASRSIEETALAGAGGLVATRVGVSVDHELLRNLLLHASVYQRETDFTSVNRKDNDRGTRLAARYLMNRQFTIEFEYESRAREFTVIDTPRVDFDTGSVTLSLVGAR